MNIKALLIFILTISINILGQNLSITGQVADASTKRILENANVVITRLTDSKLRGMSTDKNGSFKFTELLPGKYILTVSYIGYNNYKKDFELQRNSIDLKIIFLTATGIKLGTVEVRGTPTPVVLKADTTEYNAGAFKTNKDANAEDLITKMPGITVQNGTVQAQGENVAKILVDGKEFFGSDPNAALKNLPAEIIEKIQVFDQQSDQAQFTGFDDGTSNKTINIITRLRTKNGTFGKFTSGYGDDGRYTAGGNINFFNNDRRITVLAQLNNINQQNFSSDDLLGVMSSSGRGMRRSMPMNNSGGLSGRGRGGSYGGGGFGGGNVSNFLINQTTGLTQTKAFGFNYSDRWGEKIDLTASYFFNLTNNDAESTTNRDYFLTSPLTQIYNETNSSFTQNTNHRLNLRLNYQIDPSNSILFNPSFTAQINDGSSNILGTSTSGNEKLNSSNSFFKSNLSAVSSINNLLFRHRFETAGRTLSIGLNGTFTNNSGNNNLSAEDIYYTNTASSDTIDQTSNLVKQGYSASSNIVYTEPFFTDGLLQFDARIYYSEDNSDQKTFDISTGKLNLMDTSLSNVYKKIFRTQSIGTGYRFRSRELLLSANINYNLAQLINSQYFPQSKNIERNFYSILPSFMLRYNISRDKNLRIFYRTRNDDPSVDQLQDVLNNTNPTQLSIGNPLLTQDYNHTLILRYSETNGEHMRTFFILFGASLIQNYIGNNTIIASQDTTVLTNILLNRGTKLTVPVNLNGYVNLRSFITYGLPVNFLKSNLNFNVSGNYTRTPGIINGVSNFSKSSTAGLGLVLSSNISENIDFTISSNGSYNFVNNTAQGNNNSNYFSQNTVLKFYWKFGEGFVFQNELNHQYNNGLTYTYNRNTVLWNVGIGKKILSNDNGEIRISANDILNQNTNIQQNTTDSYIENVRTNVLGRYFLLSFIYNIRAF